MVLSRQNSYEDYKIHPLRQEKDPHYKVLLQAQIFEAYFPIANSKTYNVSNIPITE
jgi:hypothetical protein